MFYDKEQESKSLVKNKIKLDFKKKNQKFTSLKDI